MLILLWAVSSFTGELKSKLCCFSLPSLYHTFEALCLDRTLSLALLPAEAFFVLIIPLVKGRGGERERQSWSSSGVQVRGLSFKYNL